MSSHSLTSSKGASRRDGGSLVVEEAKHEIMGRTPLPDDDAASLDRADQDRAEPDGGQREGAADAHSASGPQLRVDYHAQLGLQSQVYLDKFRVQMPMILGSVALLQYAWSLLFMTDESSALVSNSIVFTFCATALSLLNYRNLRLFPGARRYAFILQAYLLPHLAMLGLLLWFRPTYSFLLLSLGFLISLTSTWVLNVIFRHPNTQPMMIVPSARTARLLAEMPGLKYRLCEKPEDAEGTNNLVVDLHADHSPEWERAIARAALRGASVYHVKQVSESLTGRVRIDHLSENSTGMLRPNGVYFRIKDVIDRVAACVLILATSPILALAMIAIRLDTAGPAIFRQERVGFRGETFTIYKLRTMVQRDPPANAREDAITKAGDPRITKVGAFLRKTRIDEIPQLVNVIRGDLSMIGPRPEAMALSAWYNEELDFYLYRHIVKPGITGWAQVNQGHVASPDDVYRKLQYDFYYVKNFSLWLDVLIALLTIQVMFTGKGSR